MRGVMPEALTRDKVVSREVCTEGYCDWLMSNSNGKISLVVKSNPKDSCQLLIPFVFSFKEKNFYPPPQHSRLIPN
jgi:hypothetical protein